MQPQRDHIQQFDNSVCAREPVGEGGGNLSADAGEWLQTGCGDFYGAD